MNRKESILKPTTWLLKSPCDMFTNLNWNMFHKKTY